MTGKSENGGSKVAPVAAMLILLVALVVLSGWILDLGVLKSFAPGRIEMKLPTATAFLLISVAMFIQLRAPRKRGLAVIFASTALGLAAVSLLEYVIGRSLFVDSLWKSETAGAVETVHPGRMALHTAIAFVATAVAVILQHHRGRRARISRHLLIAIVCVITLFVLVAYILSAAQLRGVGATNPMAFSTALGFLLCTIALVAANIDDWPMSLLNHDVGRIAFVACLFIPVVFGWLRLRGELVGLYDGREGVALFTVFNIVVLWIVAAWGLTRIRQLDRQRQRTHANLQHVIDAQSAIGKAGLDRRHVASLLLEHLQAIAVADGAALALVETADAKYIAASGTASVLDNRTFPIEESVAGAAIAQNACVIAGDGDTVRWNDVIGPSIAAPLTYRGINVGAAVMTSPVPRALTPEVQAMLQLVLDAGASALMRAEQFEAKQTVVDEQWAELQNLQTQFQAFMNNIPAAAYIKDREGHYMYANPTLSRFLNSDGPDVLGRTDAELLTPDVAARLRESERSVVMNGQRVAATVQLSDEPDAPHWLLLRFPIPQRNGEPFVGGVAVDISDLKRAQEQVARMNEELEERVRDRTEELQMANGDLESFSYSVSHDLRAPVRAIDGYSRILEEDYGKVLDAEGHRLLGVVRRESRRMGLLIDDLLAFSRVGRQRLSHVPIDMRRIIEESLGAIRASRPDRQIEVTFGELPPAIGDVSAIRQVVVNLLSNAAKYAKPEGPIRIAIDGRTEAGETTYSIRDNGVGFDMKYAGKLFGVFQRLHAQAEFEGTGVGLAIVQRVIAAHGGRVWAEAEVGRGATFNFTLPSEDPVSNPVTKSEEQPA